MTVVVQIGNTDNKLTQLQWSNFIADVRELVSRITNKVFFQGGSSWDAPWQNACFIFYCHESRLQFLRDELEGCRQHYDQDSIALLIGETEFL